MAEARVTVVKFGGSLLEEEAARARALDAFVRIPAPRVFVHGGGKAATAMAERLGIPTTMVGGRRVTDRAMLDVVTMVYGGLVNRTIVAGLQALGCNACGLTGADLDIIRADRRPVGKIDYGHVGDVRAVDAAALRALLALDVVPVLAPLTHDGAGALLNTNADTIASAVTSALAISGPVTLLYCFDHDGVLDEEGRVLRAITPAEAQALAERAIVGEGMLPKLETAFDALRAGKESGGALYVGICGLASLDAAARGRDGAWTEVRL